jgi:hypothetical protein
MHRTIHDWILCKGKIISITHKEIDPVYVPCKITFPRASSDENYEQMDLSDQSHFSTGDVILKGPEITAAAGITGGKGPA